MVIVGVPLLVLSNGTLEDWFVNGGGSVGPFANSDLPYSLREKTEEQ